MYNEIRRESIYTMQTYDEAQVVRMLQDSHTQRKAFELIVARYSEPLYWQIRKMVVVHDDADDLLQNTFIKAWMAIDSFRGDSKLSTWLYRIAINESITFLNAKRKMVQQEAEEGDLHLVEQLEADEWFDGDELQRNLQEAVLSLPQKQRIVFNMKYFDNMKYEEISDILGTTVGALKASYHHATKKIENFLLRKSCD